MRASRRAIAIPSWRGTSARVLTPSTRLPRFTLRAPVQRRGRGAGTLTRAADGRFLERRSGDVRASGSPGRTAAAVARRAAGTEEPAAAVAAPAAAAL